MIFRKGTMSGASTRPVRRGQNTRNTRHSMFQLKKANNPQIADLYGAINVLIPPVFAYAAATGMRPDIGDSLTINGVSFVWNGAAWTPKEISYEDYQREIAG